MRSILIGYAATLALVPISNRATQGFRAIQRQLPKYRDAKSNALSEAVSGLRQIRFLSLEKVWEDRIWHLRSQELAQMWNSAIAFTSLVVSTHISPALLASVSLSVHAYLHGSLSPSVAFTSLGLFEQFSHVLSSSPFVRSQLYDAWISCQRLDDYLGNAEDISPVTDSGSISIENATITWPQGRDLDRFRLRTVNLSFPTGELSLVSGSTGSGKSLVLAAILGEAKLIEGVIKAPIHTRDASPDSKEWIIPGCKAFVSQPPWIESCTVRDNILFGLPFDEVRYRKVIRACALEEDFVDSLTHGDQTMVGQRGASLSGGQQWRVALARALYSRAQILILDDILSAVDTHVAQWLFENALTGNLCKNRTRILATHNAEMCRSQAAFFVELDNGTVKTATKLKSNLTKHDSQSSSSPFLGGLGTKEETSQPAESSPGSMFGHFNWTNAMVYYRAGGGPVLWTTAALAIIAEQTVAAGRTWLLKKWTENDDSPSSQSQNAYFIAGYMAVTLLSGIMMGSSIMFFFVIGLNASKTLYQRMLHSVLKAPLRWIDSTPPGQILNTFTSDMGVIDTKIIIEISFILEDIINLLFIIVTWYVCVPI
jgi:ABC-type multidrug transport system fused ATPase/permease subunit